MNEQIRKLAEQADIFADEKTQMPGEYHPDWHDIRDQKFAELIVRECALVGRRHILERHGMTIDYDGKVMVEDAISNHFKEQQ